MCELYSPITCASSTAVHTATSQVIQIHIHMK
jgi:hypothetical protein